MLAHRMTLVCFQLFRKNLGNLREVFGRMVPPPPPGKKLPVRLCLLSEKAESDDGDDGNDDDDDDDGDDGDDGDNDDDNDDGDNDDDDDDDGDDMVMIVFQNLCSLLLLQPFLSS